eukprot:15104649-Alexandrium_andersonii.AAC.1
MAAVLHGRHHQQQQQQLGVDAEAGKISPQDMMIGQELANVTLSTDITEEEDVQRSLDELEAAEWESMAEASW